MRSPAPHGARQEGGAGAAPRGKEARRAPRTYSAAAPGHHGEDDEGGGGAGCGAPGQPGYKGRARRRRPGLAGSPGPGKLRPQPSLPKRARIKGKREIPSAGEEVPFWGAGRERGSVVVASVPTSGPRNVASRCDGAAGCKCVVAGPQLGARDGTGRSLRNPCSCSPGWAGRMRCSGARTAGHTGTCIEPTAKCLLPGAPTTKVLQCDGAHPCRDRVGLD